MQLVKFRSGFGEILRGHLSEQDVTLRELARRLVDSDSEPRIESKRRLLRRYISGEVTPSRKARVEIARALRIDSSVFDEDAERQAEVAQIHSAMLSLAEALHDLAVASRDKSSLKVGAR